MERRNPERQMIRNPCAVENREKERRNGRIYTHGMKDGRNHRQCFGDNWRERGKWANDWLTDNGKDGGKNRESGRIRM